MRAPKFEICRSNLSKHGMTTKAAMPSLGDMHVFLRLFLLRNDSYLNEQPGTAFENIQRFLHHRPDFMNPTLMTIFLKRGVTTTPPRHLHSPNRLSLKAWHDDQGRHAIFS